jgi:TRAP-type C4-dicarboxylate transport system permease small subunit
MAHAAGWLLFAIAFYVSLDVVVRQFFGFVLKGADEMSSYALGIATVWGCAYVLFEKSHIRIDIVWNWCPPRLRAFLNIFAFLLLSIFLSMLSARAWVMVRESVRLEAQASTPLSTPLVYPQTLWAFGLTWFCIASVIVLTEAFMSLLSGDTAGQTASEFGPLSLEVEMEREVSAAAGAEAVEPT